MSCCWRSIVTVFRHILYHFRDKARYWSKIAIFFIPHLHLMPPLRRSLSEYGWHEKLGWSVCHMVKQEAQLSQRDRATLRVIEYSATSFKVTQDHSKWQCWVGCKSLLVFYYNYVCISYRFWDIQRDLETGDRGRSRSLKMTPFDRPYTTFYWSAIVNIALSCTVFELFDVE